MVGASEDSHGAGRAGQPPSQPPPNRRPPTPPTSLHKVALHHARRLLQQALGRAGPVVDRARLPARGVAGGWRRGGVVEETEGRFRQHSAARSNTSQHSTEQPRPTCRRARTASRPRRRKPQSGGRPRRPRGAPPWRPAAPPPADQGEGRGAGRRRRRGFGSSLAWSRFGPVPAFTAAQQQAAWRPPRLVDGVDVGRALRRLLQVRASLGGRHARGGRHELGQEGALAWRREGAWGGRVLLRECPFTGRPHTAVPQTALCSAPRQHGRGQAARERGTHGRPCARPCCTARAAGRWCRTRCRWSASCRPARG